MSRPPAVVAVVALLALSLSASSASASAGKPSVGKPESSPVARASSLLTDYVPVIHCGGGVSPSFSGTGLDGSALKLETRRTGRGANTTEHVSLTGTLRVHVDAHLSGTVHCSGSDLVPVPDLPAVSVGPDFSFETTGTIRSDFTWAPSIDIHFDVSRHGFTHRVARFTNHSGVTFTGDGTARLALLLEIEVGTHVGGVLRAGLTGTVGPEITATAHSTAKDGLCWAVNGSVAAQLHGYVEVWRWLRTNKTWSARFGTFGFAPQCSGPPPPKHSSPPPSHDSVSLATLCSNPAVHSNAVNGCPYVGTSQIGADAFERVILVEDNDESVLPRYWNLFDFPATSCSSIALTFAMPTEASQPGDTASIQVTAQPLPLQSATVGYGQIGKLKATLDGHPWSLDNAATNTDDKIAINGVASCSTPSGY